MVYELPLNERTRLLLKLEALFQQMEAALESKRYWEMQLALGALSEVLNLIDRVDVRSECLKELEKQLISFERFRDCAQIDSGTFEDIMGRLDSALAALNTFSTNSLPTVKDNVFLSQIRQRFTTPSNSLSFDVPALHCWLNQTDNQRIQQIRHWYEALQPLQEASTLLLELLRSSANGASQEAQNGYFQHHLDKKHPAQLIRVHLNQRDDIYPEISGSKHRVNIRFVRASFDGTPPKSVEDPVPFELTLCTL